MYIRDPVFGNVNFTEAEQTLLEDEHMQRLRYIKQTSFAYLVYPGAMNTRFEHSIGTMHVTREIAEGISDEAREGVEELCAAGMMHDIGVAPFSHSSDPALAKYLHKTHEDIGRDIIRHSSISDRIGDSTLSKKKIIDYFDGKGKGELITGALGSDRIDYLIRDSYHTGVAYGIIDFNRIKGKLAMYKGKPAVYEEGIVGAESLLIARYFMFSSVYFHHTNVIASAMYEKALEAAIDSGEMDRSVLLEYTDSEMLQKLVESKSSHELASMIKSRRLFKRAYYKVGVGDVDASEIRDAIEKEGFKENEYVVEVYGFKGKGDDIQVISKEREYVGKLLELSPLVSALNGVLKDRKMLLVACEKRNREKVGRIVERYV